MKISWAVLQLGMSNSLTWIICMQEKRIQNLRVSQTDYELTKAPLQQQGNIKV